MPSFVCLVCLFVCLSDAGPVYIRFVSRSNIMVDRVTGKVVHIDFGDCFEVAMQRDKFPEKVPFRLTRMLVNAMEVGSFFLRIRYLVHRFIFVC